MVHLVTASIRRVRHLVPELAKFGVVGATGSVVDLGGSALLYGHFHLGPITSKAIALTPVRPRELVPTLVATYESWIRSKGFDIALQIEEAVDEQLWDRDAVSRALLNLVDNAIKYSGQDKFLGVTVRQTAEHVVIEVKDRGIGIDSNDLVRIFDPYYRAQFSDTQTRRGAGLGLTLVQQIVVSHGGRVEVESALGSGSTFRLLFPRTAAAAPQQVAALTEAPQPN